MLEVHLRHLSDGIQDLLRKHADREPSDHVHAAPEEEAKINVVQDITQSAASKEEIVNRIDAFIEVQRKEIDSNNRQEFLVPEKGRESTCARTDASGSSQGVKIQPDSAQDGSNNTALKRLVTMDKDTEATKEGPKASLLGGLEERVENIRDHLNVKFVPATDDIYTRVSALEDRIMMLESEFPPWSAEHFHQPGRKYLQTPPITIYRVLPSQSKGAHVPGKSPCSSPTAMSGKSVTSPVSQTEKPRSKPQTAGIGTLQPEPAASKRRKTGSLIVSPLDRTGKPIFHACGRGVNSSLTRSVLAQLQSRQRASAEPQQDSQQHPRSVENPPDAPTGTDS
ncbi:hypothetical protein H4217_006142 [Coemansia sp. RSA 1939]|nr:hypothetical protein H4217_006142 [Coemansia sp. RSA 1939]KAJ2608771.1 hypothetical protein EV177_004800 [Coemansia sp. RSA 1804]